MAVSQKVPGPGTLAVCATPWTVALDGGAGLLPFGVVAQGPWCGEQVTDMNQYSTSLEYFYRASWSNEFGTLGVIQG